MYPYLEKKKKKKLHFFYGHEQKRTYGKLSDLMLNEPMILRLLSGAEVFVEVQWFVQTTEYLKQLEIWIIQFYGELRSELTYTYPRETFITANLIVMPSRPYAKFG